MSVFMSASCLVSRASVVHAAGQVFTAVSREPKEIRIVSEGHRERSETREGD